MFDGFLHHIDVWKASYKQEKDREKHKFKVEEADFLPAALEILEKPASPIGRVMMILVIVFFALSLVWAVFGKVDVVATAMGKIIPSGNIKVIQPAELGVVRKILVENGQRVEKGEVLIELDTTMSGADELAARRELQVAEVTKARAVTVLEHLEGKNTSIKLSSEVSKEVVDIQNLLIRSQMNEYSASIASYKQQKIERESEEKVVHKEIMKLTETIPLLKEQVDARAALLKKGLTPRFQFLEYKERLVRQRGDLEIQKDQLVKVQASVIASGKQIEQIRQEFLKNTYIQLAEAEDQIVSLRQALTKANKRQDLQLLRSPTSGVVQQLSVHTIGGVVQAGDALMIVVPENKTLVVEVNLLNKDIGFVHAGQAVEIKLETFPFTKYGVIDGKIIHIAQNAVADENLGLVYPAKIEMSKSHIMVRGKKINLSPGMSLTAEIKTGKRRLIEFVLSPLLRYKDESLRER